MVRKVISLKIDEFMGENVRDKLKKCGKEVTIHPFAKITNPEVVEIGDYSRIDDFTFINGGAGIKIGRFVHIASFTSIIGGGELDVGDFSGISAGSRIITGSDDFSGRSLVSPCVPAKYKPHCYQGNVKLCRHVILGTNTVVHPNVTLGEGAATGSNTLVTKDLEPWGIYTGSPAKRVKDRSREMLELEKQFIAEVYGTQS